MAGPGRNDPCPCGSGRKVKRCCGEHRGPGEDHLARAYLAQQARDAARRLRHLDDGELRELFDDLFELPELDLALTLTLPQLLTPDLQHLFDAVKADDPDAGDEMIAPDERCRVLRRRLARREQLVHARTRAKQEVHAVLHRRLQGKPPSSDLFGVKGRAWLAGLDLPGEERESVDAAIRHVNFLDHEITEVERLIAQQALTWPEIRRLMTVPGVNLICAASFMAAIGNASRFMTSRKLVAYLGLDPKVRQSGEAPARSGRISKRGSASARWALVEAAWTTVRQPGPLHAFYERTRGRRGHGKAIVASARKLAVLFWCMLTRGEDYAHQQPSLTAKKLRKLELKAGAPKHPQSAVGIWSANRAIRLAERQLAEQAEVSYKRLVQDQQAGAPARKVGASATPERA
ncbi:MAG: IS110 family transposase [Solirubrobacterales bacterium]|nr:IS110 family transposase [Solirubrobacterales bacterium]